MKSFVIAASLLFVAAQAMAADNAYTMTIENHVFTPKELKIPAGQRSA